MARSVAIPRDAAVVAYQDVSDFEAYDWQDFVDDFTSRCISKWPSVEVSPRRWIGNECRVVARNRLALFGVSEYCGLAALWVVPEVDDYTPGILAENWVARIAANFEKEFGTLRHIGSASNGEAFFQRIEA